MGKERLPKYNSILKAEVDCTLIGSSTVRIFSNILLPLKANTFVCFEMVSFTMFSLYIVLPNIMHSFNQIHKMRKE